MVFLNYQLQPDLYFETYGLINVLQQPVTIRGHNVVPALVPREKLYEWIDYQKKVNEVGYVNADEEVACQKRYDALMQPQTSMHNHQHVAAVEASKTEGLVGYLATKTKTITRTLHLCDNNTIWHAVSPLQKLMIAFMAIIEVENDVEDHELKFFYSLLRELNNTLSIQDRIVLLTLMSPDESIANVKEEVARKIGVNVAEIMVPPICNQKNMLNPSHLVLLRSRKTCDLPATVR